MRSLLFSPFYLLMAVIQGSTDVAVPFSRLADIIEVSKKEMDDLGLFASILGHVGDGNFHESIMYNRKNEGELEKVETCVKNMVKRALTMEGTCTGEHSIGWGKKESLLWEVGPDTLAVMVGLPFVCVPVFSTSFGTDTLYRKRSRPLWTRTGLCRFLLA